ncbi:MAG: hypothetical protein D4R67_10695 [Bacteroidetes bacterium]|nr:MAG: hypothetical protein D4R67_10695 [Bacteroidota bacterium]
MKILLVSSTRFEILQLMDRIKPVTVVPDQLYSFRWGLLEGHLLIPGIGILPTAFSLGKLFVREPFDLVLNAGVCGAYTPEIPLGTVVQISEEALPEPGVDEDDTFRSIFDLGLMLPDTFPFTNGKLINPFVPVWESVNRLKAVPGNTIQRMQTDPARIRRLLELFPAEVESMEGAAFLYCCLAEQVPCLQIRSVSNYVGERNKVKWEVRRAIKNLNDILMQLLEEIGN